MAVMHEAFHAVGTLSVHNHAAIHALLTITCILRVSRESPARVAGCRARRSTTENARSGRCGRRAILRTSLSCRVARPNPDRTIPGGVVWRKRCGDVSACWPDPAAPTELLRVARVVALSSRGGQWSLMRSSPSPSLHPPTSLSSPQPSHTNSDSHSPAYS